MKQAKTRIIIKIELMDIELLTELNIMTSELSISLEDFIISAIDKMLQDIKFIRSLRNFNQKKECIE